MRRYKEAYAIYDEIYEVRKSILGNMHPDTLAVEFYLARLKFMNGKKMKELN
jgi:pheromone shutdown protein TraB